MKGMPSLKDMAVKKTQQTSVKTEETPVTENVEKIMKRPAEKESPIVVENPVKKVESEQDMYESYTTMVDRIFDLSDIRVVKPKREKRNSGNGRHPICVYLSDKEYAYADRVAKRHKVSVSSLLRILLINSK